MSYTILHIDSSPGGERSFSRKLTAKVIDRLREKHPDSRVIHRDLSAEPMPHLTGLEIAAFYTAPDDRDQVALDAIRLSDTAVDEVLAADAIVIGAPMHNFGIPSSLKAWIDHIARTGRTFSYGEKGPVGLVPSKTKAIIVSARGGVYTEGPALSLDFQENYLKAVLGFLGLTDVTVVRAEGVAIDAETVMLSTDDQIHAAVQPA